MQIDIIYILIETAKIKKLTIITISIRKRKSQKILLSHRYLKWPIVEEDSTIANDRLRGTESQKVILFGKLNNNFSVIEFGSNRLSPIGNIIHSNKYILFFEQVG